MRDRNPHDVPDLRLVVNGNDYEGWYDQAFSRSMEDLCGKFSLSVYHETAKDKSRFRAIKDGDKCQVYLGRHLMMTGWVDGSNPFYSRTDVGRKIQGRDLAADVVDSSARYASGEWVNATFDRIASDLCKAKGIKVVVDAGVSVGAPFSVFRIETGETIGDLLSRAASYRGLMVFSTADGNLLITQANKKRASTVIKRGSNIISAERSGGVQELYHVYRLEGQGDAGSFGSEASSLGGVAYDHGVRKTRELIVPAETGADSGSYKKRADHTAKQRRGRAVHYIYTLDNWVHVDGTPWNVNERVDVDDPEMDLDMAELIIAGTDYKVDRKEGKVVTLTLKFPQAFDDIAIKEPE